jgi:threonine dehydratase
LQIVAADGYDATEVAARRWAADHDVAFVSAFDHPVVMAGNGGTLALEILEAIPEVATLLVPVGGGGLLAGVACVVRALRPAARILGVQSEATRAMHLSLQRGMPVLEYTGGATWCDGLEGGTGALAFEFVRRWVDDVILVPEIAVADAMRWLWEEEHTRVEGAAAVGVAACMLGATSFPGPVCAVLTGCNIDDDTWERVTAPRK